MKYPVKNRIEIAHKIASLYSQMYTIESCCESLGINYNTFQQWACPSIDNFNSLPDDKQKELKRRGYVQEVHDIIVESKQIRTAIHNDDILYKAYNSLERLLQGYTYKDVKVIKKKNKNGKWKPYRIITHERFKHPSITAILYVLNKLRPEYNDLNAAYNIKVDDMYFANKLTDEQLNALIVQCERNQENYGKLD